MKTQLYICSMHEYCNDFQCPHIRPHDIIDTGDQCAINNCQDFEPDEDEEFWTPEDDIFCIPYIEPLEPELFEI